MVGRLIENDWMLVLRAVTIDTALSADIAISELRHDLLTGIQLREELLRLLADDV